VTPWSSADGLHWRSGSKLNTSSWTSDFKSYDAQNAAWQDPEAHDSCAFEVNNFQEGPATLLVGGDVLCGNPDCGAPWSTSEASWTSSDGLSWVPANLPAAVDAYSVSGGSRGFAVTGYTGDKATSFWISSDGRTWHRGEIPSGALAIDQSGDDPASFAGGFVFPGVVMTKKGTQTGGNPGGCSGGDAIDRSIYQAALWWSPDGSTWTKQVLPGVLSGPDGVNMSVIRIDDLMLVADELTTATDGSGSIVETQWESTDGKAWTRLSGSPVGMDSGDVVAARDRGLLAGSDDADRLKLSVLDPALAVVTLKQSGAVPPIDVFGRIALGPTGVLATVDGSRFWIGVPKAD
jgi:hypothetical protein